LVESEFIVGSDEEFQKHEAKRVAGLREQDGADFTAEMKDTNNGRMKRFGFQGKAIQDKADKRNKKQLLAYALKVSTSYAALYKSTMQNLHGARDAVYEAQLLASMGLGKTQKALKDTIEQASMTPDGVAVFLSKDGNVYDQNGQKLDNDTLSNVFWRDNAPSWEDYQKSQSNVQGMQERLKQMNGHSMRLDVLQTKMEDEDNPPSIEEMQAVQEEVKDILNDARKGQSLQVELSIQKTAPATLPDLKL
jgi:hypothetical protein